MPRPGVADLNDVMQLPSKFNSRIFSPSKFSIHSMRL